MLLYYSRASSKRPPKVSNIDGRLQEVVAYESLGHTGLNFASLAYRNCKDLPHDVLFEWKVNSEKKSVLLPKNAMMLHHLIIQFSLDYLSSGLLRDVKNKGTFQAFSSKSGRGRLREVVAYKRFQYSDLS